MQEQGEVQEEAEIEDAARSTRQRLWAADVSCYYAQRRFSQTGRAADRRIWESCQQETQAALAAVRAAERRLPRRSASP